MNNDISQNHAEVKSFWGSRSSIGLIVMGSIALCFLLAEHRAHFSSAFLLQWPTPLTLLMFPTLLVTYTRLAVSEEKEMRHQFGELYEIWAARTPRFIPVFGASAAPA
jgi:protein-S-isoprenylcysteine O-methyltransferase Ste14